LRPQPLGDLKRDADFEAVAGEREGKQPFGALEAVEDRVAVGVQGPGGACGAELLADVHAQGVAQFAVSVSELAERPRDELASALLVLQGEGYQLDIGEPGDLQVRAGGTSAAGWQRRRSGCAGSRRPRRRPGRPRPGPRAAARSPR
jgi:hypothetical protein